MRAVSLTLLEPHLRSNLLVMILKATEAVRVFTGFGSILPELIELIIINGRPLVNIIAKKDLVAAYNGFSWLIMSIVESIMVLRLVKEIIVGLKVFRAAQVTVYMIEISCLVL